MDGRKMDKKSMKILFDTIFAELTLKKLKPIL